MYIKYVYICWAEGRFKVCTVPNHAKQGKKVIGTYVYINIYWMIQRVCQIMMKSDWAQYTMILFQNVFLISTPILTSIINTYISSKFWMFLHEGRVDAPLRQECQLLEVGLVGTTCLARPVGIDPCRTHIQYTYRYMIHHTNKGG